MSPSYSRVSTRHSRKLYFDPSHNNLYKFNTKITLISWEEVRSVVMEKTSHARQLAETVFDNLKYQHDWTELKILTHSPTGSALSRPMITGLPQRRLYVHPDDQISMVKSSAVPDGKIFDTPETEWVLATHISEKWTIRALAGVFDSLPAQKQSSSPNHHPERPRRIVLATVHDDSTVVYYILHDGIVKPRQN